MNLFNEIKPEIQVLINQNPSIINECLLSWVKAEKQSRNAGVICVKLIIHLQNEKQKKTPRRINIAANPKRVQRVKKILKLGYEPKQIAEVITWKVNQWWGTDFQIYLTPETLLSVDNFPKYHEELQIKTPVNNNNKSPDQLVGVMKPLSED